MYLYVAMAVLFTVAGVWFLARPLARGGHVESRENFHQLQTVRDRLVAQLNELDMEELDRNLPPDTAADERARLQAELAQALKDLDASVGEVMSGTSEPARSNTFWRWTVVVLAVGVPTVATGFYFLNANTPITSIAQMAAATPVTPAGGGMPNPMEMVARLEQRLQQNPGDLQGWLRLGRSYAVLGRLDDAVVAYDHAYGLLPKDFRADNPDALWFLGLAAYNRGEGGRAIVFWEELLKQLPPGDEAMQQLQHVIEQAKKIGKK